jgi:hypothetical protein
MLLRNLPIIVLLSDGQDFTQNSTIIDEVSFQEALLNMKHMLSDLFSLCKQGLLRTFHDEEECGKIAGSVGMEGHGVLLSADERRSVLDEARWIKEEGKRPTRMEECQSTGKRNMEANESTAVNCSRVFVDLWTRESTTSTPCMSACEPRNTE